MLKRGLSMKENDAKLITETLIRGRKVTVHNTTRKGVRWRYTIEGVTHPKGSPIRFKSLPRAENHIDNMKLGL